MNSQFAFLGQGIVVNSLKNGSQKGKGHCLLFYGTLKGCLSSYEILLHHSSTLNNSKLPGKETCCKSFKITVSVLMPYEREKGGCNDSQLHKIQDINKILPFPTLKINYFHASMGLLFHVEPITQDTYNISDSLISLISSGRLISIFWCSLIWIFPKHCYM